MLDIRSLRASPDTIRTALNRRGKDFSSILDAVRDADERRRKSLQQVEALRAERNAASDEVARLKREKADASTLLARLKDLSESIKVHDVELRSADREIQEAALGIPNIPLPEVPDGDASSNEVVRVCGDLPTFDFEPKPHWELGESLGLLDLHRGAKVAGSGFPMFVGLGARLVRGLVNFMLDLHVSEHDYVEIAPPYLVNGDAALGTGQLPDLEQDMYVTEDGLYLIPTAEIPITNLRRDEILSAAELPQAYVAYSPCFRREAGAHGKDTRGLIRVHQFDKVELVRMCAPADSPDEHQKLLGHAEEVLRRLGIPYRVVLLAAGDLGFASAKTYDLEVWAGGVAMWLEASSASTFTDFQARRASIRYRPGPGAKPEFVHTLNASGVALPRTVIALLENNQSSDGTVSVPEALVPYVGVERLTPGGGA